MNNCSVYQLTNTASAGVTLEQTHLKLSADPLLSVGDRYRQLAAYHALHFDYRQTLQAMWASTIELAEFVPLKDLKAIVQDLTLPRWLASSGRQSTIRAIPSQFGRM
ncbi:hypothetical protein R69749_06246 [Paraburkholderia domus]|nr:hypothetical protein R69749_06246 [Paraburkholderia domus]